MQAAWFASWLPAMALAAALVLGGKAAPAVARGRGAERDFSAGRTLPARDAWRTADDLPQIDLSVLPPQLRCTALDAMRALGCTCGCTMKIAECRMVDPICPALPVLTSAVLAAVREGKQGEALERAVEAVAPEPFAGLGSQDLSAPVDLRIGGAPSRGPLQAPVVATLFLDPGATDVRSRQARDIIESLRRRFPDEVRVVVKLAPRRDRWSSMATAQALAAAHAAGKFWELRERLARGLDDPSCSRILELAGEIGMEATALASDLDSGRYLGVVERDLADAAGAGISAAPAVFLNERRYRGKLLLSFLETPLLRELEESRNRARSR